MASIIRFVQRRLLSPSLINTARNARCAKRSILIFDDGYPSPVDILLHEFDLPAASEDYFKLLSKEQFLDKFGIAKKMKIYDPIPRHDRLGNKIARKRAIVLPIRLKVGVQIAVPFIVDTGAPSSVYLGTKALSLLKDLDVLEEIVGMYPYMVNGSLYYGEKEFHPILINPVPSPHELASAGTLGHPCCNILGLEAVELLGDDVLPTVIDSKVCCDEEMGLIILYRIYREEEYYYSQPEMYCTVH